MGQPKGIRVLEGSRTAVRNEHFVKQKSIRSGAHWQAHQFDGPDHLAASAAHQFLELMERSEGNQSVGLSGGRITESLFREIARQSLVSAFPLDQLQFFWADERCVPLDDPGSNYRLAKELLFDPLKIDPSQTFPFAGGDTPKRTAEQGSSMICEHFGVGQRETPVFDLIFLGMGEDGHIASLFPENQAEDLDRDEVCYEVVASKPPPNRITLSYSVLAAAREIWIVISGEGKANVLKEALQSDGTTPIKQLLSLRRDTKIFTDISLDGIGSVVENE
jgi:6-phosphogluconolactonase